MFNYCTQFPQNWQSTFIIVNRRKCWFVVEVLAAWHCRRIHAWRKRGCWVWWRCESWVLTITSHWEDQCCKKPLKWVLCTL